MNDYSTRGVFSLVFGIVAAVAAVVAFVKGIWVSAIAPMGLCAGTIGHFLRCRSMTREQWEEKYGRWDERENAIEGRTTAFTLKVCVTALFAGSYFLFMFDWKIQLFIDAVLVLGVLVYVISGSYFEDHM